MIAAGTRIYGLGAAGLGLAQIAYGRFDPDWLAISPSSPLHHLLAEVAGGLLVAGGLAIVAARGAAVAGLALALLFAAGMLLVDAPGTAARPAVWGSWQAIAESVAMGAGGLLAFAGAKRPKDLSAIAAARIARGSFGACLIVFGVSHFVYAKLTASLVPAWLPPSQMFWALATGVGQFAAGLSILTGIAARAAAILLAAMYATFQALVHTPAVLADPSSQANWTESAINLVLLATAWQATAHDPLHPSRRERDGRARSIYSSR